MGKKLPHSSNILASSLMYVRNNSGPIPLPWMTPLINSAELGNDVPTWYNVYDYLENFVTLSAAYQYYRTQQVEREVCHEKQRQTLYWN